MRDNRFYGKSNDDEIRKQFDTAQEWLRLITTDATQSELSAFIDVVHANWHMSPGWTYMAPHAYIWVAIKGIPVPSPEEFFAKPKIKADDR